MGGMPLAWRLGGIPLCAMCDGYEPAAAEDAGCFSKGGC